MMPSFTSSLPGQALMHLGGHVAQRGRRPGNVTHSSAGPPLHHSPSLGPTTCTLLDRKSTRLNSSHLGISYAVFCLKKRREDSKGLRSKRLVSFSFLRRISLSVSTITAGTPAAKSLLSHQCKRH